MLKGQKDRPAKGLGKFLNLGLRKIPNLLKIKRKVKRAKGGSRSRSSSVRPNTSAYGEVSDKGGKHPKQFSKGKAGDSDSDVQLQKDYEGHSDSLTDS